MVKYVIRGSYTLSVQIRCNEFQIVLRYVIYKMSVKNTKHTLFITNHLNENQLNLNIHERKFFLEDKHPASLRIRLIKVRENKV